MQPPHYHQLLSQQLGEAGVDFTNLSPSMQALLQTISQSYASFDEAQKAIEAKVKLRTDQLVASTSRAYSFLDSLQMGFIMCDVSAEVVLTNRAVQHTLAQKMTATNDKPAEQTSPEWTIDAIDRLMQPEVSLKKLVLQSLSTNQPLESPATNFGKRVLHLFIAPMVNQLSSGETQQIGAVILVEDITEQKVLERSKDEFLSIASHELRTPLTAIRGNASLIKQYYGDRLPDKDTLEMIDDIHESAIRLIDIVNDFLDASSLEQGKMKMNPETFVIEEVIISVIRELHTLADSKGLALICDQSVSRVPSVTADKQHIKQVVYNLLGNAVKFTDKGSINVTARADEHYVYVTVTDSGKGMSAENQQLLFRKFQQAGASLLSRDNTKGTGMGLYISRLIIEQSHGTIELAHSQPGQGSAFVFSLPIAVS